MLQVNIMFILYRAPPSPGTCGAQSVMGVFSASVEGLNQHLHHSFAPLSMNPGDYYQCLSSF